MYKNHNAFALLSYTFLAYEKRLLNLGPIQMLQDIFL